MDILSTEVFFIISCIYWAFLKCKDNKLAANHSFNWVNTDVISILKSIWLEWVTIRVVSSAKWTGLLELFPTGLVNRRFIYWNQHQVKNYSNWLILRTRLANRTSFISGSYWYRYCNILPIIGRSGRRFAYAGYKQLYTQFTLAFPRTFSHPNSNLTIQTTRHARDSGYYHYYQRK